MMDLFYRLEQAIKNYKEELSDEREFLSAIESITASISECELSNTKTFLENIISDLGMNIFTIDKDLKREEFFIAIFKIEDYLEIHFPAKSIKV